MTLLRSIERLGRLIHTLSSAPLVSRLSLFTAVSTVALFSNSFTSGNGPMGISSAHASETRSFQAVAIESGGTKIWLPSTFIVKKGDTVKIHALSKIGGKNNIHGFAIDEFKVQALVDDKGLVDNNGKHSDQDIEFVANKTGVFPIRCHLHPAHIGGQLLVLD